jgi:hypothetical protein
MQRVTISLRQDTFDDVDKLSDSLGCSRSALIDVVLARGLLKHLRARADFLQMSRNCRDAPTKRLRGNSIRELEETIHYLEITFQGELWDAVDDRNH